MPKRWYFPSTTAADVTPAANGAWGFTTEALNRKLSDTKSNTAQADGTQIGPWTAGQSALDRRYVSAPLAAQSISGTVKMQLMTRELASTDNSTSRLEIYVVSNDGSTVRGTLKSIANYGPTTEYSSGVSPGRNKTFADGDALSAVTCLDGDRLVVAVGHSDASGTTPEAISRWGDATGTSDLPENETQTTDGVGWIEFSNIIFLQGQLTKWAPEMPDMNSIMSGQTRAMLATLADPSASYGRSFMVPDLARPAMRKTVLTSGFDNADGAGGHAFYTTASVGPVPENALVVAMFFVRQGSLNTATCVGLGSDWNLHQAPGDGSTNPTVYVFSAHRKPTGLGGQVNGVIQINVAYSVSAPTGCAWTVVMYEDGDYIRQQKAGSATSSSLTITLPGAPLPGSAILGMFGTSGTSLTAKRLDQSDGINEISNQNIVDLIVRSTFDGTENPLSENNDFVDNPGAFGGVQKVSGQLRVTAASTNSATRFVGKAISSNQRAKVTLSVNGAGNNNVGPCTRIQGNSNGSCYTVVSNGGDASRIDLYRVDDSGTLNFVQLGAPFTVTAVVAGDTLELQSNGSTHEVFYNGGSLGTRNDATYTGGQPGISLFSGSTSTDLATDWEAGELPAVTALVQGQDSPLALSSLTATTDDASTVAMVGRVMEIAAIGFGDALSWLPRTMEVPLPRLQPQHQARAIAPRQQAAAPPLDPANGHGRSTAPDILFPVRQPQHQDFARSSFTPTPPTFNPGNGIGATEFPDRHDPARQPEHQAWAAGPALRRWGLDKGQPPLQAQSPPTPTLPRHPEHQAFAAGPALRRFGLDLGQPPLQAQSPAMPTEVRHPQHQPFAAGPALRRWGLDKGEPPKSTAPELIARPLRTEHQDLGWAPQTIAPPSFNPANGIGRAEAPTRIEPPRQPEHQAWTTGADLRRPGVDKGEPPRITHGLDRIDRQRQPEHLAYASGVDARRFGVDKGEQPKSFAPEFILRRVQLEHQDFTRPPLIITTAALNPANGYGRAFGPERIDRPREWQHKLFTSGFALRRWGVDKGEPPKGHAPDRIDRQRQPEHQAWAAGPALRRWGLDKGQPPYIQTPPMLAARQLAPEAVLAYVRRPTPALTPLPAVQPALVLAARQAAYDLAAALVRVTPAAVAAPLPVIQAPLVFARHILQVFLESRSLVTLAAAPRITAVELRAMFVEVGIALVDELLATDDLQATLVLVDDETGKIS